MSDEQAWHTFIHYIDGSRDPREERSFEREDDAWDWLDSVARNADGGVTAYGLVSEEVREQVRRSFA